MKFSFKWNAFITTVLVPGIIYLNLGELRVPSFALNHKLSGSPPLFIYIIYVICIFLLTALLVATPKSDLPFQKFGYICVALLMLYLMIPIRVFPETIIVTGPPRRYIDCHPGSYPKTNIFLYIEYVFIRLNILYLLACVIKHFPQAKWNSRVSK